MRLEAEAGASPAEIVKALEAYYSHPIYTTLPYPLRAPAHPAPVEIPNLPVQLSFNARQERNSREFYGKEKLCQREEKEREEEERERKDKARGACPVLIGKTCRLNDSCARCHPSMKIREINNRFDGLKEKMMRGLRQARSKAGGEADVLEEMVREAERERGFELRAVCGRYRGRGIDEEEIGEEVVWGVGKMWDC